MKHISMISKGYAPAAAMSGLEWQQLAAIVNAFIAAWANLVNLIQDKTA